MMLWTTLLLTGFLSGPDPFALLQIVERSDHVPAEGYVRTDLWSRDREHRDMEFRFRQGPNFRSIESDHGPSITERNGHLIVRGQRGRKMLIHSLPPQQNRMDLALLRRNYTVTVERQEELLGRNCHVVKLRPRLSSGNGQRIWIDARDGFVLGRDQYDSRGNLHYRSRVIRLKLLSATAVRPPRIPDRLPPQPDAGPLNQDAAAKWLGHRVPMPQNIPAGYALSGIFQESCPDGSHALRLSWSDGLSDFSIFLSPQGCRRPVTPPQSDLRTRLRRWFGFRHSGGHHPPPPNVVGTLGSQYEVAAIGQLDKPYLIRTLTSMGTAKEPFRIRSRNNHSPKEEP